MLASGRFLYNCYACPRYCVCTCVKQKTHVQYTMAPIQYLLILYTLLIYLYAMPFRANKISIVALIKTLDMPQGRLAKHLRCSEIV